ncbi:hypothetical protein [Halobacterium jilantaiense]|uniref:Uncharacterized protein n=1 Tax=Halobacterium jilantaiense TaxID=355548 RepID=A0A1I0MPW3_9EURY|nr:hypothetical protein [Halobacterium jilantaiense]SEV90126.1 hypothetical protein SAMN04487945_0241 [Halobacterium jilantaiense]
MVVKPDGRVGLTDDETAVERAADACSEHLSEETPELFDAMREHSSGVASAVADSDGVPGAALDDEDAVAHLREFVRAQYDDDWFGTLGEHGSEQGLTWAAFRTAARRFGELLALQSFARFHTAEAAFREARGRRSDGETAVEEAEEALQYRNEMGGVQGEESFESLVDDAREAYTAAQNHLESGAAAMRRAHALRTASACYREEYDVESDELAFVSLDDDLDWEYRELRHGRDRLANRLSRLESDVGDLVDHPRYGR